MSTLLQQLLPGATAFEPRAFMLAGNATFTVVSQRTGTRFTFKVRQPGPDKPHFVSLLSGPDNENDFTFLGTIFDAELPSCRYAHGRRSHVGADAPSAKAANWVCNRILSGRPLVNCEIHHEGRCGRCGRKLTVPESILSGFGPECASRL